METSVEFLERMYKFFNIITPNDFKKAKQLEKKYIANAYNEGRKNGQTNWGYGNDINAKQYYKETFKKK